MGDVLGDKTRTPLECAECGKDMGAVISDLGLDPDDYGLCPDCDPEGAKNG